MREIVLDTETTGFNASGEAHGDRIVEIGCIELINHIPTGEVFHVYINPQRAMPADAFKVHGLSDAFLQDKPVFADIADDFLHFIGDARLIIHNAPFDKGFLDMELARLERPPIRKSRVRDTLAMARRKFPGGSNSLDALCARFGIDNSSRTRHGALLDAELLTEVYVELIGGKQVNLELAGHADNTATVSATTDNSAPPTRPAPLPSRVTGQELRDHAAFIDTLQGNPLWKRYRDKP